jgi:hypothetical protein
MCAHVRCVRFDNLCSDLSSGSDQRHKKERLTQNFISIASYFLAPLQKLDTTNDDIHLIGTKKGFILLRFYFMKTHHAN